MTEPTHLNPRPAQDIDYGAIGRSAWAAYTVAHGFDLDHPDALPWDLVDEATRDAWVAAGRAAVNAYDAQLTGQADAQAETLLNGPEKQPQADSEPDLLPPGHPDRLMSTAEPEHVEPDPHENPAYTVANAYDALLEVLDGGELRYDTTPGPLPFEPDEAEPEHVEPDPHENPADAWATDPDLDPVQDEAGPEHVEPDPHENPADAYAKALAAEQSNTTEHN